MDTRADEGRQALEALYADQAQRLGRALLGYTGDPDIASDCMSEAFAEALRQWERIDTPEGWLWRVAFRLAGKELSRRRRPHPAQASTYVMDERALQVTLALAKLSGRQRAVVVLHYYIGYTTQEIGDTLGMSASTASVHLHRGRRRLHQLLGEDVNDDA